MPVYASRPYQVLYAFVLSDVSIWESQPFIPAQPLGIPSNEDLWHTLKDWRDLSKECQATAIAKVGEAISGGAFAL